jgi:hypothetical protein
MKKLIYNKRTYQFILLFTSIFAIIFMVKLFFFSSAYYKIKCEGIILDKKKEYVLTNQFIGKKHELKNNKILLEYPKNNGYMPNYLGKLYFVKKANNWVLKLSDSIQNKKDINKVLPFVRKSEKNGNDYEFFSPKQEITFQDLENGIVFNRFGGTAQDRIELKIFKEDDLFVLKFDVEGINREYKLKKNKQEVSIQFNSKKKLSDYNFYFEKTSKLHQEHQLKITTEAFGYRCFDENEREIKEDKFAIGNAMFSIKPIIPFWQIFSFIIIFLQAIFFSIISLNKLKKCVNPIEESVLLIRFCVNQLVLIGLPLFITTFNFHADFERKIVLIIFSFLFNLSFYHKEIIHFFKLKFNNIHFIQNNLQFVSDKTNKILSYIKKTNLYFFILKISDDLKKHINKNQFIYSLFLFFIFVLIFAFGSKNERIYGTPAIHFQKIVIIVAFLIFSMSSWKNINAKIDNKITNFSKSQFYKYLPLPTISSNHILIVLLSFVLSIASQDFGAILYVLISILLIEAFKNNISLKNTILLIVEIYLIIGLLVFIGADSTKLYRFLYTFFNPGNSYFSNFNEADREAITYLYHGLKSVFSNHYFGYQQDLIIPKVCQSVSFSDYAFFWSFMISGVNFLALFLIISFFLFFHFSFLLRLTLNKIQINETNSLNIPNNKYGKVFSFWFSITLISFIYPFLSNLAIPFAILTGQSIPFISVGIYDIIIITGLILVLEYSFKSKKYITYNLANSKLISEEFKRTVKTCIILFLIFIAAILLKGLLIHFQDNLVVIKKNDTKNEKEYVGIFEKNKIATQINLYDFDKKLDLEQQSKVNSLLFAYYKGKEEPKKFLPDFKMNNNKFVNKISLDSFFKFGKIKISGIKAPFGNVYSKKYYFNGETKYKVSNDYYENSLLYDSLNTDLNAEITKALEKHIKSMNRNIEGTVIIRNNQTGSDEVVATYSKYENRILPIENTPYFIGSVKKPILLVAALKIDEDYKNYIVKDSTITQWIAHSSNNFTQTLLADILSNHSSEFNDALTNSFSIPFYSITSSSYSDYPNNKLFDKNGKPKLNDIRSIGIGGNIKYTPMQVVGFYQNISILTFEKNDTYLKNVLNAPLQIGTANKVAKTLKENGINPVNYIAKTGTFQKGKNKNINLSSSFAIANKDFTIFVALNGEQQANNEHKSAKYFFNKIIPLLLQYDVLHKSKNNN